MMIKYHMPFTLPLPDLNDILERRIMSVIFTASDIFTGTSTIFSCCSCGLAFESNMYLLGLGRKMEFLA